MIRIGILGDIGSGKSYVANNLDIQCLMQIKKYQNFIKKTKKYFKKLKKILPKIYLFISNK